MSHNHLKRLLKQECLLNIFLQILHTYQCGLFAFFCFKTELRKCCFFKFFINRESKGFFEVLYSNDQVANKKISPEIIIRIIYCKYWHNYSGFPF